jgi:hypothetical protein
MTSRDLPTFNAICNALSAIFLLIGFYFIRRGRREVHMRFMLAALGASTLFLAGYLTYHYLHGSTRFVGTGAWRTVYFAIGYRDRALGGSYTAQGIVAAVRPAPADRSLDPSSLAIRIGDRSGRVLDAVPALRLRHSLVGETP